MAFFANEQKLTIAMPKGRIFEEAVHFLQQAGLEVTAELQDSRKLVIPVENASLEFILAKPADVPTYVEYGVADVGVVGKDVLLEEERDVYELLDLQIGYCRMMVAGLPDWKPTDSPRVATKYPKIASRYFREQGQQVEVIKLNGSVELAPMIGLADRIVDIVSTGRTLKENGLVELEHICEITTRLIANRASYRMKSEAVDDIAGKFLEVIPGRK
ncbi:MULTISPECIES: ATP phosphoribosyltransferase [Brevibacillus]|jgi:ATP phosphoribosyltransferase|uniref:ATP phosphoribosyltransferase n=1 Tax=Brevibacillus parabrevis TaxID=54914 RepID=A0A4Y3PVB8_BREPA|nr:MULTISPECIES: ATP phosphoribosyltransferase [Brevibacillus]KZE48595.1 ATP phosphoribosyltransferase [Brevibacillus parabrevis]MBU8713727.1 ATP phosphoribosyltransferase [Brevibacillus parabrevis]MDH6350815.1 ATP phosphoribosyltransferase [Brevibacillus sp. 1238]MDR4997988.1 ATP phosphoribosyltransferase [Brevibacillus parabrevis]MED1726296.1 ATP phosphoribosyltransferase [Brevibacillus parabrevis]